MQRILAVMAAVGMASAALAAKSAGQPAASTQPAAQTQAARPAPADWISLFNGKDLAGWKAYGDDRFSVVDGAICCEATNQDFGWLVSDGQYSDFVLKLRFRWEKSNTGIQFRSSFDGKTMVGYQADLDLSNPDTTGTLHEQGGRRMLQHTLVDAQNICDLHGWNEYEIYAVGDHIQLFINGIKTADFHDSRAASGILAFQAHAGQAGRTFYKDIRILPLRPGTAWKPLFNGKDLTGWKTLGDGQWSVSKGVISGRSGPKRGYAWLTTDREYGDFVLKLKFCCRGGNSGVQFRSWVEEGHMHGYQADIDPSVQRWTGMLYDEREEGTLVQAAPEFDAALKKNDWNTYEISAIGDHIQLFVNGIKSVDTHHGRTAKGLIGLQIHSGGPVQMEWKDLYILELGPSAGR